MKVSVDLAPALASLDVRQVAERRALAATATAVVRHVAFGIRKDGRRALRAAGLSARVANTLRVKATPMSQPTAEPVGRVYSRFIQRRRPGGPADVLSVLTGDTTISARGGKWLAIPFTGVAGTRDIGGRGGDLGTRKVTPADYAGRLAFRPIRGTTSKALLVLKAGAVDRMGNKAGTPVFLLVRRVFLRKRWDLRSIIDRRVAEAPALTARHFAEERAKVGL